MDAPPIIVDEEEKEESSSRKKEKKVEEVEVKTDDSDSDYDEKSEKVNKKGSTKTFTKISFNYDRLSGSSSQSSFVNLGKPPHFDAMGYSSWRHKMCMHLSGVNPALWKIMCVGVNIPNEDEPITQDQEFEIQHMQATSASILFGSLSQDEFDKADGMDSTKEIWDTLQISHEGTGKV